MKLRRMELERRTRHVPGVGYIPPAIIIVIGLMLLAFAIFS